MNNRYRILIQGKNPRYFLSMLIHMHISIYQKEENSLGIILVVNASDYQKIMDINPSYKNTCACYMILYPTECKLILENTPKIEFV